MSVRIQFRRDTAERWAQVNPVLSSGEPGYEIGTGLMKIGDGATAWNDLDYQGGGGGALPPGGVDGQVLTKTVGAAAWRNVDGGTFN